uniref:Ig-like domain-containing protein n=1 Tax=Clastoptera arizonana TaxID=38151 RepID=A0A1B6D3A2_9HEMI
MKILDLLHLIILFTLFVMTFGGCQFPIEWSGSWFQSAIGHLIMVNSSYIETKGECVENQGDKYITVDRTDRDVGYRCIVIHEKHPNVLQYKESMVLKDYHSLDSLCHDITGDAVLLSMFRAEGAIPIPCPFKSPPYSFSYNRGNGDCDTMSKIDSCTDESRLLFTYLACVDVVGTESSGEELVCLAKWKDGATQYLIGKIHNAMVTSDEDRYRCFVYERIPRNNKVVFRVAQSGDATCNGLLSSTEGSKIMVLTRIESQHERCKFPSWVTNHHHWHSLDYKQSYHFSHKNATLKISRDHGITDMKLVCHNIENNSSSSVTLVAHVTEGCSSGYICLVFHHRDSNVIQLYQSNKTAPDAGEACGPGYFNHLKLSVPVTLVTSTEQPSTPATKCSNLGRYTIKNFAILNNIKKRSVVETSTSHSEHCTDQQLFSSLTIGCNGLADTLEFHSSCPEEQNTAYYCHGSWTENTTSYLISSPVSRKSTDAKRYCFVFKTSPSSTDITVERFSESCSNTHHRLSWTFNLTSQGKCTEISASSDSSFIYLPPLISLTLAVLVINTCR